MNEKVITIVKTALKEDIPNKDISSEYLFDLETSKGNFIAKEAGVISGILVCQMTFKLIDKSVDFNIYKHDGESVEKGDIIASVSGRTKSILMAERVGLNFLQRMSGIATLTSKFVAEIKGTKTKILDTRKTTPNLRILEKQAVKDGGGENHRMSLSDMVMLKDNHIKAAGSIIKAVDIVKSLIPNHIEIEVEVETVEQFKEALMSKADVVMLDNMSLDIMKECVSLNKGQKLLEASGNMSLKRIREVSETGVDFISVGELTHSYRSLDISLKF
jgi:nicotinate-nucleotide pyrophosphorylase (carboxylating)